MSSISPPQSPKQQSTTNTTTKTHQKEPSPPPECQPSPPPPLSSSSAQDDADKAELIKLRHLLLLRDQEIQALKFELEKYKLALHQSQVDYHYIQHKISSDRADDDNLLTAEGSGAGKSETPSDSRAQDEKFIRSGARQSIGSSGAPVVVFKAGDDFDETDEDELRVSAGHKRQSDDLHRPESRLGLALKAEASSRSLEDNDDELEEIIHDVGEIDLNLDDELEEMTIDSKHSASAGAAKGKQQQQQQHNPMEDDEDIISDGLLTSLTDAAIINLSQLAALQERCESQQHSQQHQQQQQIQQYGKQPSPSQRVGSPSKAQGSSQSSVSSRQGRTPGETFSQDLFSAGLASQALSAPEMGDGSSGSLVRQPISSSGSLSPSSTLTADLSTCHSLANVVAAAAAAAAATNDQQQQQHQQYQHHLLSQMNPSSRLISSALNSQDFYQIISQHRHPLQVTTTSPSLHHHLHQQQHNVSPVSSLHYSSPSSITPSPSSMLTGSQSRRSAASNATSSSLMSPIASPNYLRRQFMSDRMSHLSPSPTSGLGTGTSSQASTSLAHNLHQQQRSASALAGGPITGSGSVSSTPLSGTESSAVSPLMSNKNSSQARLNNMQIRHKFGYLGSSRAQFNSPHGFCLGLNQEIVVADTNNHRVCIFDKSGTYLTQFGSPGKEEGQLWNPRKVAILHRPVSGSNNNSNNNSSSSKPSIISHHRQLQTTSPVYSSGKNDDTSSNIQTNSNNNGTPSEPLYVVCDRGAERSRMQLFTKDGAFIKKIGIHYIDIVAGLAITQNGLIIVVDSVSPTVYIINGETGILDGWFDCSGHMKEPSDIVVKSDDPGNEYFICDFKGHCVVVFNEQGDYLRKIGHDGLTSYPNGIDISDDGDILVGDSHGNRFHVVVFDRNGNFVSQFECPHVKVSRCCGLKITREGYIVTLAKNNHHVLVLDTIHI